MDTGDVGWGFDHLAWFFSGLDWEFDSVAWVFVILIWVLIIWWGRWICWMGCSCFGVDCFDSGWGFGNLVVVLEMLVGAAILWN